MMPLQSGQKVDNAIPKAIYIIKNYFFTMIVQRSGRHYMKNLIQCTHSSRQSYHYIRLIQHHIFTVTQIICTESHIHQIAGSSTFFQFIIEPLSLAALAIHSINPILAPPYTNVFLFCPIQTPNSRAFSKNTGSIFSDAEQKIAILSIILFSVSKYKYLHFLKNGNNFCCIFANRNLFEAKNNVIQYFHLA